MIRCYYQYSISYFFRFKILKKAFFEKKLSWSHVSLNTYSDVPNFSQNYLQNYANLKLFKKPLFCRLLDIESSNLILSFHYLLPLYIRRIEKYRVHLLPLYIRRIEKYRVLISPPHPIGLLSFPAWSSWNPLPLASNHTVMSRFLINIPALMSLSL